MAQTKPKAAQFYGVSGNGTAGQVLISDGNGGMTWGANTENYTVSWNTPTGQSLTYTQPTPQSSSGAPGSSFPSTTFTVTKSDTILSGTATIAGLPTGITATQVITGSGIGNTLTVTLSGVFPAADSLNTDLTLSGLTLSKTVSWATPTGQSLTYTQPTPQSSSGSPGSAFPTTTFTATKSGEEISGTATIAGLPTGITATQSLSGTGADNVLTVTLTGVFPGADSLNTALTISGLTIALPLTVDYLVVAGGGAGVNNGGNGGVGGGGAGGYLTNHGGTSLTLATATPYSVTVGAGGVGNVSAGSETNGSNSIFHTITSIGGGKGGQGTQQGFTGGSGGGSGRNYTSAGGLGTAGQGNDGGAGGTLQSGSTGSGGGGGGAGSQGSNGVSPNNGGNGGSGLENQITGATGVFYAGGGGGGSSQGTAGTGGSSIGGAGSVGSSNATDGSTNTGSGGGGCGGNAFGGNGGSGVVIIRYPNTKTVTIGSGLTGSTATDGSDKVTTFTAGTGNIQFN